MKTRKFESIQCDTGVLLLVRITRIRFILSPEPPEKPDKIYELMVLRHTQVTKDSDRCKSENK